MSKIIISSVFLSLIYLSSSSQWLSDVRLTLDPAASLTYFTNAWQIAAYGNYVHVVWTDDRDGNDEIYYKRSTNAGVTWLADTRLTNNSFSSQGGSIAVSGAILHVLWSDARNGGTEIYYKRSTNNGSNWGADTRLTNNSSSSYYPSAAVSGQTVYIVWQDSRDGNSEIYFKRSTNDGVNWDADLRLSNNSFESLYPAISAYGGVVQVLWHDNRDGNYEIYQRRSIDGGQVYWGAETRLTSNSGISRFPSVAGSVSNIHLVWEDNRDNNFEIYYKRSVNGGFSWSADTQLTSVTGTSGSGSATISVTGQLVHVVFASNRAGNAEVYYKRSTNGGVSWEPDVRLTYNSAFSQLASVACLNQSVHVVWTDERDGNEEIYYKRNPTGIVGVNQTNKEIPEHYSLSQNYPNPFNPVTKIKFSLPNPSEGGALEVKLLVYDILGREITNLIPPLRGGQEGLNPGSYEVEWNGSNYPSGVYFYKLTVFGASSPQANPLSTMFSETKKMVLLK